MTYLRKFSRVALFIGLFVVLFIGHVVSAQIPPPVVNVSFSDESITQTSADVFVDISGITSTIDNVQIFWRDSEGGEIFSKVLFTKPEFSTVFDILPNEFFPVTLDTLSPDRTYVIQSSFVADGFGTIVSPSPLVAFTTLKPLLSVSAQVSNLTHNSVTISGTVSDPSVVVRVRYGTSPDPGLLFNVKAIPSIASSGEFSVEIPAPELQSSTKYYFEIRDLTEQSFFSDSFTTLSEPRPTPTPTAPLPLDSKRIVPKCNTTVYPATTIQTVNGDIQQKSEDYVLQEGEINLTGSFEDRCDFNFLLTLINNVIDFLLFNIAIPIAAIAFAYAGFILLSSGGAPDKRSKAKAIFINVLIGLVIALSAWLIVKAIFFGLGLRPGFSLLGS
ncbi:hypothetical protein COB64_02660 [Candidatus Wolfebacteria bacterium]|nr:MAG: hypothetical protein COB64_02660 [Candidatus Wolfebacteria bacterium]